MRKLILLITLASINLISLSQNTELYLQVQRDKFKSSKDKLVVVGQSPNEVKSKIGNPKAVEGGFPEGEQILISEFPEMVGQMNYSTWLYSFNPIDLVIPDAIYFINGELTSERIYNEYKDKSMVFYLDGKLISYGMGEGYRITKKAGLQQIPLNRETTKYEDSGAHSIKVIPLYCVIFDKGTQVVAATKSYFLK